MGRTCVLPGSAPSSYFSFRAELDLTAPEITHTPLVNTGQPMWPATVTCTATDNIGLDSVWVEWYRNIPANSKSFRLNNTGGINYSAMFNSANNEVSVGDSIFYVLKAKDNSSNHNMRSLPAAGFFKFSITSLTFSSFCKETWAPIRDNQTTYDTLLCPLYGVITDFNFKMESLIHSYDGDVSFSIISPSGQEVELSSNNGSGGDNYTNTVFDDSAAALISTGTAPFTGTFRGENPLQVFIGQNVHGNWILKVSDNANIDTGHVEKYCLQIQYVSLIGIAENNIPRYFELKQNYPNPFNPVTKIKYSIPKQAYVLLTVYDILGREVSRSIDGIKPAGNYELTFDGTNLASGVYFYRITAGDFTDIKKMVLIK
jgi:subtilisin-like proprotein convertase family protein